MYFGIVFLNKKSFSAFSKLVKKKKYVPKSPKSLTNLYFPKSND